jgi:phospholipid/cholesterol/gamma-HCH transport system substrate-binding protein
MPRTRSLAWSELKIGMLAVGALVLAGMLIVAVGGQSGFAWQRYELKTKFDNVQGLKSGAIVRVAGVEVGKVTAVAFSGTSVEVRLSIRDEMQSRVTTDSRASIGSLSLLGEPIIDVTPASTGRPLKNGEYIQSTRPAGQLSDMTAIATQSLEQATALLQDVRAGKGTVGKLFTDEQLYREFNELVGSAQEVTTLMSHGQGTLGMLMRDPRAYQRFQAALTDLQEVTRRINAGEGSLGRLLKDEAFAKSLTSATANFDQVTSRLTRNDNTAGKLLTEKELYERINSTAERLDRLTKALNEGEGSAGQFLHNKEMYDNMNKAASELRSLIADIRKDPKKYLNVKVSIF